MRMATDDYVPVASDDWYQRRREDEEGKFFRQVADQGPQNGKDGATRQGIYCFTATGKLLAFKNAGQSPQVMREVLQQGLAAWKKLPPSQREPGAVHIDELGPLDLRYDRRPPAGGLIINVFTRALDRKQNGEYCDADCKLGGGDEAARDHLWLREAEWRSLIPLSAKAGDRVPLPAAIVDRITRFHLVDNTRGEPPFWQPEEIRSCDLTLIVEKRDASQITLRLEGSVLLSTVADPKAAKRGYDAKISGHIHYDASKQAIDGFDLVAVGEHWGDGPYTRGARPGRTPLGVAFELATGDSAADHVPPQGARVVDDYFGRSGR